jgi:hypothetical protein
MNLLRRQDTMTPMTSTSWTPTNPSLREQTRPQLLLLPKLLLLQLLLLLRKRKKRNTKRRKRKRRRNRWVLELARRHLHDFIHDVVHSSVKLC